MAIEFFAFEYSEALLRLAAMLELASLPTLWSWAWSSALS